MDAARFTRLPLRPDRRAMVLRFLAGLPATDARGVVRDPEGRPGLEVVTEPKASSVEEPQPKLLLDQGAGEPLTAAAYATTTAGDRP
ncbi:hypothetical protein ACIA8R_04020 [Nonomuraea sp. NPDC051191]|uniref:hypothetical protein n=1 Tax=Nonomuraea sp. NPDC051191 TaxID=3364372 RepID=UPI003790E8F0